MATNKIGAPGWCCPTDSDLQGPCYSCLTTRALNGGESRI